MKTPHGSSHAPQFAQTSVVTLSARGRSALADPEKSSWRRISHGARRRKRHLLAQRGRHGYFITCAITLRPVQPTRSSLWSESLLTDSASPSLSMPPRPHHSQVAGGNARGGSSHATTATVGAGCDVRAGAGRQGPGHYVRREVPCFKLYMYIVLRCAELVSDRRRRAGPSIPSTSPHYSRASLPFSEI